MVKEKVKKNRREGENVGRGELGVKVQVFCAHGNKDLLFTV